MTVGREVDFAMLSKKKDQPDHIAKSNGPLGCRDGDSVTDAKSNRVGDLTAFALRECGEFKPIVST